MHIPVDTARLMLIVTGPGEPVTDFATKRAKLDERGVPPFATQLAAVGDAGGEVYTVKTPGAPAGAGSGHRGPGGGPARHRLVDGGARRGGLPRRRTPPVAPPAKTAAAG
ncbi:MAG: hypothetical protein ACYDAQ_09040 [Mycobacteriales bacterium]